MFHVCVFFVSFAHFCVHWLLGLVSSVLHPFYSSLDFVRDYPGELVPEPIWILLKQETVNGSGISFY